LAYSKSQFDRSFEIIHRFSGDVDKLKEGVVGLLQVVRHHDERVDESDAQIKALRESVKQTTENLNALIRIVEGQVSNHP
jgi:hypothetical protein